MELDSFRDTFSTISKRFGRDYALDKVEIDKRRRKKSEINLYFFGLIFISEYIEKKTNKLLPLPTL